MYLVLPVFLIVQTEEEEEQAELLGKEVESKEVMVSINISQIVSHWQGIDGYTHFTLTDSREHVSNIDYDDFVDILDDCLVSVELKVNDN
jgi:hypothetical protein